MKSRTRTVLVLEYHVLTLSTSTFLELLSKALLPHARHPPSHCATRMASKTTHSTQPRPIVPSQPPKLTGKRPSMDVQEYDQESPRPLVPDIPASLKASICEQLARSLTESHYRAQSAGSANLLVTEKDATEVCVKETTTTSRSKKFGKKMKSLLFSGGTAADQGSSTSAGRSENDRSCARLPFLDDEEEELYAYDPRSRSRRPP